MSKVQLQGNVSGTGVFTIASPNSNTDRTLTLPNETGTILTSGGAIAGTTGTFSGIIQANGGGIQFPATQVPSADANTLDDYEEGSWTPTVAFGGNSVGQTYITRAGYYIKIGRQVTAQFFISFSNKGTSTGIATVSGLPFAASSSAGGTTGGSNGGYTSMLGIGVIIFQLENGNSAMVLRNGGATSDPQLTDANFNPGLLIGTITYFSN
jgi:hypothetical protein